MRKCIPSWIQLLTVSSELIRRPGKIKEWSTHRGCTAACRLKHRLRTRTQRVQCWFCNQRVIYIYVIRGRREREDKQTGHTAMSRNPRVCPARMNGYGVAQRKGDWSHHSVGFSGLLRGPNYPLAHCQFRRSADRALPTETYPLSADM